MAEFDALVVGALAAVADGRSVGGGVEVDADTSVND